MPGSVTLDLCDGFDADEVSIRAPGIADINLAAVTTRLQIGRARSLPLPETVQVLHIELPRRAVQASIDLLRDRPLWVAVSLSRDGKRLEVQQQHEPFGYL